MKLIQHTRRGIVISSHGGGSVALFYTWATPLFRPFNEGGSDSNFLVTNDPRDPATYLTVDDPLVSIDATFQIDPTTWEVDFTENNNSPAGTKTVTVSAPQNNNFSVLYPGVVITGGTYSALQDFNNWFFLKNGFIVHALPISFGPTDTLSATGNVTGTYTFSGIIHVSDNTTPIGVTASIPLNPGIIPPLNSPYFTGTVAGVINHNANFNFQFHANTDITTPPGTHISGALFIGGALTFIFGTVSP